MLLCEGQASGESHKNDSNFKQHFAVIDLKCFKEFLIERYKANCKFIFIAANKIPVSYQVVIKADMKYFGNFVKKFDNK